MNRGKKTSFLRDENPGREFGEDVILVATEVSGTLRFWRLSVLQ